MLTLAWHAVALVALQASCCVCSAIQIIECGSVTALCDIVMCSVLCQSAFRLAEAKVLVQLLYYLRVQNSGLC